MPYTELEKDTSKYIDKEYMPKKFIIMEPRDMKLHQIIEFFDHISDRESTRDASQVFRFKNVKVGRSNKVIAAFMNTATDADSESPVPRQMKRKYKRKGKARNDLQCQEMTEPLNQLTRTLDFSVSNITRHSDTNCSQHSSKYQLCRMKHLN